jgi:hypothetical protein
MHRVCVYRFVCGSHRFFSNVRPCLSFLLLCFPLFLFLVHFFVMSVSDKYPPARPQQTRRKFLDKVRINVKAGDGGDGCASFERTIHGIGMSLGV